MMNPAEIADQTEDRTRACQSIGSVVICLHYLSREAGKDNIEGLTAIIDEAIARTIALGCGLYEGKLKREFELGLHAQVEDVCVFIDRFCAIEDPATKKNLANIVKNVQLFDSIPKGEAH